MHPTIAVHAQCRPVEIGLPITPDVQVNQPVRLLQPKKSPQFAAAVLHLVHNHAGIVHPRQPPHLERRSHPKRRRGTAIDGTQSANEFDRLPACISGIRGINVCPREVGHQKARNSRPLSGQERKRRCITENGGILLPHQPLHLVVQPRKRLGMNPRRQRNRRRSIRGIAVAGRIDRPHVRDKRLQLRGPPQPLAPVTKEIRVRLDRDRYVRGHSIQHGGRSVQMAESVAGHVNRQTTRTASRPAAHRVTTSFARTSPGIATGIRSVDSAERRTTPSCRTTSARGPRRFGRHAQ